MLTQEAVQEIVSGSMGEIKEMVLRHIRETLAYQVSNAINGQIKEQVSAFVTAEIVPEVQKALIENKAALIAGLTDKCSEMGNLVGDRLKEMLRARLAGYGGETVLQELFK